MAVGIDDDPDGDRRHFHGELPVIRRRSSPNLERLYTDVVGINVINEADLRQMILNSMGTSRPTIIPHSAGTHFRIKWEE